MSTTIGEAQIVKVPVEVDVSTAVPFDGTHVLRGWVCAPSSWSAGPPIVMCCLPGGTCTTKYFDLQVDGLPGYSMAEYLAALGLVVVSFDHLGVGESSRVDDIFLVTADIASATNDHAHREVLARIARGDLRPHLAVPPEDPIAIGTGHSMGGMLVAVQQAHHRTFDAIALLGHSAEGLPEHLRPDELELSRQPPPFREAIVNFARRRFDLPEPDSTKRTPPGTFLAPDVPDPVRSAFIEQQTRLLFTCGLTSMIPNATSPEKATVDVPVLLAFGEFDMVRRFHAAVASFPASSDVTLFVLGGSAHCHNQAGRRQELWDRLATFARTVGERSTRCSA